MNPPTVFNVVLSATEVAAGSTLRVTYDVDGEDVCYDVVHSYQDLIDVIQGTE